MSDSVAHFAPRFVLRKINPKDISQKYSEGYYENRKIPLSKIKVSEVFHVSNPSHGSSSDDPRYQFKDKNNASVIVVTSNSKAYTIYKQSKQYIDKPRTCPWCLRSFDHSPIPVVVKLNIKNGDKQYTSSKIPNSIYYIFWTINVNCCSFPCAFSWIKRESYVNYRYKMAYEYMKILFKFIHPGKKFFEAPDWRLLDINDGPLSSEEFDKGYYKYKGTSNIIFLPAKEEFIQIQLN